jgi:carbon monoxide dehydrogenase subunit G
VEFIGKSVILNVTSGYDRLFLEIPMFFEGAVLINASKEQIWNYLTDPNFVAQCAPGVKEMVVVVPDEKYQAVAAIGFGPITAEFLADIEYIARIPQERARIKAHGDTPGSAVDAVTEMILLDGPDHNTELKWTADITIVGSIANVATRLMGPVTRTLTGRFFDCVKGKIEAPL